MTIIIDNTDCNTVIVSQDESKERTKGYIQIANSIWTEKLSQKKYISVKINKYWYKNTHHSYANLDLNPDSFKVGASMALSLHCPHDPISAKKLCYYISFSDQSTIVVRHHPGST